MLVRKMNKRHKQGVLCDKCKQTLNGVFIYDMGYPRRLNDYNYCKKCKTMKLISMKSI